MQAAEHIVFMTAVIAFVLSVFAFVAGCGLGNETKRFCDDFKALIKQSMIGATALAVFILFLDAMCLKAGVTPEGIYVLWGFGLSLSTPVVFLCLGLRLGNSSRG